jgi:hypothetical protein
VCPLCNALEVKAAGEPTHASPCSVCQNPDSAGMAWVRFLKPEFGFTTDANVRPTRAFRPEVVARAGLASRSIDESRITVAPQVVDGIELVHVPDGDLFAYNEGAAARGFAICWCCGRSESESPLATDEARTLPPALRGRGAEGHRVPWGSQPCSNDGTQYGRFMTLASEIRTDVLRVRDAGRFGDASSSIVFATTWMAALVTAATSHLNVDVREVGGLTVPRVLGGRRTWDVLLFDNAPGGAGHCGQVRDDFVAVVDRARALLIGDAEHDRRCQRACQSCLISYQTQRQAPLLDRGVVLAALGART